jgi:hypothetical protein
MTAKTITVQIAAPKNDFFKKATRTIRITNVRAVFKKLKHYGQDCKQASSEC